jgi:hypothetical protein
MKTYYDSKLRPIHKGDVLRVFHFIGPRNKKCYMYKIAMDFGYDFLFGVCASEIGLKPIGECHKYPLSYGADKIGVIKGTEIIDGHENGYFQDREKLKNAK